MRATWIATALFFLLAAPAAAQEDPAVLYEHSLMGFCRRAVLARLVSSRFKVYSHMTLSTLKRTNR